MTTYEELKAQLAQLVASREARAQAEEAQRRAASGDAEIAEAERRLRDPALITAHVEAEEAWCSAELQAIGAEDAPLTQAIEVARAALASAELHRGRERARLRHEDRRREVDRRRDAARQLRDQAMPGEGGDGAAPPAGDGVITSRTLATEAAR